MEGVFIGINATLVYIEEIVYWINYSNTHAQITMVEDRSNMCMGLNDLIYFLERVFKVAGTRTVITHISHRRHRYTVTKVFS